MGRIEGKSKNRFKTAVEKCDEIKNSFKAGLSALGKDSLLIKVKDTNLIDGSVDIDSAVKGKRPSDTRWDYAVGYSGEAYFIEVHPIYPSTVLVAIKGLNPLPHSQIQR